MQKGVRWIKGREYLLCGRAPSKEAATVEAAALATQWERVRIIKLWQCDFLLYVHGSIERPARDRQVMPHV